MIEPIFEPDFHPSSYGYRPNRSCHNAIAKADMFMNKYGFEYVVDMDLSKCFDTLNHEIILKSVNVKKTHIANIHDRVAYLGFIIKKGYMVIHPKRIAKFKDKIKKLTPRNTGINIATVVSQINSVIRGWTNYFRVSN